MSKKDPNSMDLARRQFVDGAVKRGVKQKVAERVYDQIQPFAGYAFNKAHSTAYALLIYQTAYLKAHYAPEFMTASLSSFVENTERLKPLLEECRRLDIGVLPPDVNSSSAKFTVLDSKIRYGLSAVKNMGSHASEAIVRARESGEPFSSLFDFTRRVELTAVTKQALESLAKAGAFDAIHPNRAAVLEAIPLAIEEGRRFKRIIEEGQLTIFGDQDESDFEVTDPALPAVDSWSTEDQLAAEQEALGFFLSGHPLDRHRWLFSSRGVRTPSELPQLREGISITVGGQVVRANKIHKDGSAPFCFMDLEDNTGGRITAAVFDQAYADSQEFILPGSLLAVRGRLRKRKGELQINANEVIPLLDISGQFVSLTIHIANDTMHESVCPQLQSIFSDFPGKATVNAEVPVKERGSVVVLLRNTEIEPCEQLVLSLEELPFVVGVEVGLGDQGQ
jgi:DNA polymerase-3 subunit alpha